ncbi:MAG TPA: hypothetical protein VNC41_04990 [Acidimicrobiia bacterium]|nr:hypothetical protein [Acidimicrobiia bacterium]
MSRKRIFGAALPSALVVGISIASTASGAPAEPALTLKLAKAKNVTVKWSFAALPTRDGSAIEIERSVNDGAFARVQKISRPKPGASWTDKFVPHGVLRYQARLLVNDEARPYGAVAQITVGSAPTTTTVAPSNPTGTYRWSAKPGGERWLDSVIATDVAVATDGTVLATGQFQGTANFGTGNRASAGNNDIFVAKYSATGSVLWVKTYGGAGLDKGAAIAVAPTGEVVVAGTFANTVDFGAGPVASSGDTDGFLLVLTPSNGATVGNVVKLGGLRDDSAFDVAVRNSAIAVSGTFSDTASIGGTPLRSSGGIDAFVAQYSLSTRTPAWGVRLGDGHLDRGWGVAIDSTGAVVLAADRGTAANATNAVLTKRNGATGAAVWTREFNAAVARAVAIGPNDDIVFAGTFSTSINLGGGALNALGDDVFVARLAPDGVRHIWSKRIGNVAPFSYTDTVTGVSVDATGNAVVTGSAIGEISLGGIALPASGGADPFLAKYSPTGQHVWSKRFPSGDAQFQFPGGVATGPGNVVATAGGLRGRLSIDGHLLDARYRDSNNVLQSNQSDDGYVALFAP